VATTSFLVRKELTAMAVGVSGTGANRTIVGRLTEDDGVPLGGRKVSFWVDGTLVSESIETNESGIAKIAAPAGYQEGAHTYTVVFDGDTTHEGGSGSAKSKG
jgi:hypothetical protein